MLTVAQWCAAAGWPVHPLSPGRKTPAGNCRDCAGSGHSPRECPCLPAGRWCHGFHCATLNLDRLCSWWGRHPDFGVGVACGPAGLVVIDVDAHPGPVPARERLLPGIAIHDTVDLTGLGTGFHTLALLAALRGAADPAVDESTLRVRTPSGGLHIWYRAGAGRSWLCSAGSRTDRALAWQVDVRGTGGYIVAPGTATSAGVYTPVGPCRTPAALPEWLARELTRTGHLDRPAPPAAAPRSTVTPPRARQAVLAAGGGRKPAARVLENVLAEVAACAAQPEGAGFSDKLNRAAFTAGGLVAGGLLSEAAAQEALLAVADHARPHQHRRATQIIRSGLTAGARRPLYPGDRP
ncbi:bifunctional DNA primase/polymerase [Streptomyces sp. NPDC050610]|uniref:bifunctional DNA primase/polymerase n=1 Tax=Streptomyces sp. NPDC050610 TaxID=3157097 RepID=UPI0034134A38